MCRGGTGGPAPAPPKAACSRLSRPSPRLAVWVRRRGDEAPCLTQMKPAPSHPYASLLFDLELLAIYFRATAVCPQPDNAPFNRAWAAGQAMSLDEAVAYALKETEL